MRSSLSIWGRRGIARVARSAVGSVGSCVVKLLDEQFQPNPQKNFASSFLMSAILNIVKPHPPNCSATSHRLMLPYCLQIGASTEQVFTSFTGSASCPVGSAVSGWYNLPGVPVKGGTLGGPKNFTGLQLLLSAWIGNTGKTLKHSKDA